MTDWLKALGLWRDGRGPDPGPPQEWNGELETALDSARYRGVQQLVEMRTRERERCAKIAHDRGLRSHKDFRWMAEEIEAEIRNG